MFTIDKTSEWCLTMILNTKIYSNLQNYHLNCNIFIILNISLAIQNRESHILMSVFVILFSQIRNNNYFRLKFV